MENNVFEKCMELVNKFNKPVHSAFIDNQLVIAASAAMEDKLREARKNGRYGWSDPAVCSIDYLYDLRDKALQDSDHVSALNYTAMIAMRESVQASSLKQVVALSKDSCKMTVSEALDKRKSDRGDIEVVSDLHWHKENSARAEEWSSDVCNELGLSKEDLIKSN